MREHTIMMLNYSDNDSSNVGCPRATTTAMASTLVLSLLAAPVALAQEATITLPTGKFGKYDPTLSAKEAVLANWEMAASGIRAGSVLGGKVVAAADDGASFAGLRNRAAFAQETMLSRYHAAAWMQAAAPARPAVDEDTLRNLVAATSAECAAACDSEIAAIRTAFAEATAALSAAATDARDEITSRQDRVDAVLLSEQLRLMAEYLDGGTWADDLVLTEFGMDGDVVADRIVGAMTLWRNVEPYVGLTDPEIDTAINAASRTLLRTLRFEMRDVQRLEADGPVREKLTVAAKALADELHRASALFAS